MSLAKSLSCDQGQILADIIRLHCPDGFDADLTYGSGGFWRDLPEPRLRFDIDPQADGVQQADSRMVPVEAGALNSVIFDPPFLTYVRAGREGNGQMIMARRFSGYWRYEELEDHYQETISEASRILRDGGVLVVKCQDIVHNHRLHPTHALVLMWADLEGFALLDLFVLGATNRLPAPNRAGTQKHARVFHSYFLVFKKRGKTSKPRRRAAA
jgi:hypothetical protein